MLPPGLRPLKRRAYAIVWTGGVLSYLRPRWRHVIDADHLVNV